MLEIRTGCRLHFGLLELCRGEPLCFGGFGLMVDQPQWRIQMRGSAQSDSPRVKALDEIVRRTQQVVDLRRQLEPDTSFPSEIEVAPLPLHCGLGAGTQLGCAVALGLEIFSRCQSRKQPPATQWTDCGQFLSGRREEWLIRYSGRGLRSGIGLQGALTGGLILDAGYAADSSEPRTLKTQIRHLPEEWRVLLILSKETESVSGAAESKLLDAIGSTPNPTCRAMHNAALKAMALDQFDAFAECLEEYLAMAGNVFRQGQGGMYNGAHVSSAVAAAKECGLRAVGQSSWGPTVFGLAASARDANKALERLHQHPTTCNSEILCVRPATQGTQFQLHA